VDRRNHIGGNAYDFKDEAGVLIHKYGSHLFHTNSDRVMEYLSKFTEWIPAIYTAKSLIDGQYYNFPINLNTFEQIVGHPSSTEEMEDYLSTRRVPIAHPKNSEEAIISQVGWELYNRFYKNYTTKHWKRHPRALDASVCARVPIRTTRNDLYFNDKHQCMPKDGFTALLQRMVASPNIEILLNTDYREVQNLVSPQWTVYTGSLDEYFGYVHGPLPYRTTRFEAESFGPDVLKGREHISGKAGFWQPTFMVSYPNDETFTRIIEIKHVTGQLCENTTIVKDFPDTYVVGKEQHYPIPAPDAEAIYAKYKALAETCSRVSFVGRLAAYRYYNIDQVVASALVEYGRLRSAI